MEMLMPTMNISLTETLATAVRDKVDSGLYGNASEVIREALRLMLDRDQQHSPLEQMQAKIRRGLDQAERGEFVDQTVADIIAERKVQDAARQ